jgi:uncharacterized protein YbaP (TraB family)
MNRFLSLFFILLALFLPQGAISKSSDQSPTASYPLYLAQKEDIKIYILGSMHLGTKEDKLNDKILNALKDSSKLILEVSLDDMRAQTDMFSIYICKDPCLLKQLGKRLYKKVGDNYPELYFLLFDADRFPAWLIAIIITNIDYMKLGFLLNKGMEEMLIKKRGRLKVFGLESAEEQLEILAGISLKAQREILNDYLNMDKAEVAAYINNLYSLYLEGDADHLFEWYMQELDSQTASKESIDEFHRKILSDRNRRFINRLKPHLAPDAPVFLSVGALHLGGGEGILALLREDGYTIFRL